MIDLMRVLLLLAIVGFTIAHIANMDGDTPFLDRWSAILISVGAFSKLSFLLYPTAGDDYARIIHDYSGVVLDAGVALWCLRCVRMDQYIRGDARDRRVVRQR